MAKNPAFPFYAQDYLIDTLRWTREMKSLHIDLMCESWANGVLTDNNGAPEGLTENDILIWQRIKHKWVLDDGFWYNEKLEECRDNRKKFLEKQSLNGKRGGRPKKENPEETQPFLKTKPKQKPLEEEKEIEEIEVGGLGEEEPIVPAMVNEFKKTFPKYPTDEIKDFTACFEIAKKIGEEKNFNSVQILSQGREHVLKRWGEILSFIKNNKWYSTRSIEYLNKDWQQLIQTINAHGTNKTSRERQNAASAGVTDDLKTALEYINRGQTGNAA